jgi:hypothetical protein
LGKIPNIAIFSYAKVFVHFAESLEFCRFSKLARSLQSLWHLQESLRNPLRKDQTMQNQNTFTSKLTAAASAFMISLVLIAGTVTTPQTANAQTTLTVGEAA